MTKSFSFRVQNSFIILLCLLEAIGVTAQGRWEALGSPATSNILKMISTSDRKLFIYMPYSGVQYSEDLGEHWIPKSEGLPNILSFTSMIAGPNGSVFMLIDNTIYKLKDVNSEWELLNTPIGKIDVLYLGDNKRLFCILGPEVYVSDDEGSSFQFFLKSKGKYGQIKELAYTGKDENYFIDYESSVYKLFRFDNQASHIDSITKFNNQVSNLVLHPNGNLFMYSTISYRFNKISKKLESIKLNQNSNKVIKYFVTDAYYNFITFDTLTYISSDGGMNWVKLQTNPILGNGLYKSCFLDSLLFFSYNNSCNESKLLRVNYFDTTYSDLQNTFANPTVYSISSDSINGLFITTCFNWNPYHYSYFKNTLDQGKTWTNFQIRGKDVLNLKKNSDNKYYTVCSDTAYTSTDLGITWTPFVYKISPFENFFIAPDHSIYNTGLGGPYLIRLNEDGTGYKFIETGICCDGDIYSLLFHPSGRIYINWSNNLYYSDEKGENANRKISIQCNSCELSSLGDLYNIDNGLYFIEPDLSNMTLIEPLGYTSKIVGHDNSNNVFVYDFDKGLLLCNRNGCKNFEMNGLPFPYMFIKTVYQDEHNYLYAGLRNDKIYKFNEPVVSTKNPIATKTETIKVLPNPFSSNLNVEVLKSKTGSNHVLVQDVYGRTIHESFEKNSVFKIETESMPSGVYLIRVGDSGFRKIIKI